MADNRKYKRREEQFLNGDEEYNFGGFVPEILFPLPPTPSITPTISLTPSITPTISLTPSITPTISLSPSVGASQTPTPSLTTTPTITPTLTPTITSTATPTPTLTPSSSPLMAPPDQINLIVYDPPTGFNPQGVYSPLPAGYFANNSTYACVGNTINFQRGDNQFIRITEGLQGTYRITQYGWSSTGLLACSDSTAFFSVSSWNLVIQKVPASDGNLYPKEGNLLGFFGDVKAKIEYIYSS